MGLSLVSLSCVDSGEASIPQFGLSSTSDEAGVVTSVMLPSTGSLGSQPVSGSVRQDGQTELLVAKVEVRCCAVKEKVGGQAMIMKRAT